MTTTFNLYDVTFDAHARPADNQYKLEDLRRTFTYAGISRLVENTPNPEQVRWLSVDMYLAQLNADELDEYRIDVLRPLDADEQVTCFVVDVELTHGSAPEGTYVHEFHRYIYAFDKGALAIVLDGADSFLNIECGYLYNLRVYSTTELDSLNATRLCAQEYLNRPNVAIASSKVNSTNRYTTRSHETSESYPDNPCYRYTVEYHRPIEH